MQTYKLKLEHLPHIVDIRLWFCFVCWCCLRDPEQQALSMPINHSTSELMADPESWFSHAAGCCLNYVLLKCCILKFISWLRKGSEWSERVKSIFEGGPWLNLSSSIKRKEICVQEETTKPEEKGKVLWRDRERTTPPVVYKEWLPIQSTRWHPEMSLHPTS